ncbi:MAG TPA: adenylyltransferase/cytidyltransferase family protein [Candidatus Krumholzibacteria bacterium]|nr:adenylyltransferase/cytidyltransferase family protein [Candidatus Krumholzibacteria bacterium]
MTRARAAVVYNDARAVREAAAAAGARRVVLANGCFDPLHVGHVRYLADAANHGDFLVVAVNDDGGARRLKGPGRPVVPAVDRCALVAALRGVAAVLVFGDDTVEPILRALHPAVHAKGTDYTRDTVPEREIAVELGIETVIAGDAKTHASREIVGRVRTASRDGGSGRE